MPSDAPTVPAPVLDALRGPAETFHSALVSSAEELRGMLHEAEETGDDRAGHLAAELGPFANGLVDGGKLAALLTRDATLAPAAAPVLKQATDLMDAVLDEIDGPVFVEVPPGGDLRDAVRDALGRVGRVFGAARVADLARSGAYRPEQHDRLMDGVPFRAWTGLERLVAPPLVVRLRGSDLLAASLSDFLDGALKIVLLVEGDTPPAPLARLVTPGVMVVQTGEAEGLAPLAGFNGPAVAALFEGAGDDGFVPFVHDPRGGVLPWRRIELKADLDTLREAVDEKRWSRRSWLEDVEHLLELATPPSGEASGDAAGTTESAEEATPGTGPATGADRLAAWLIARTDLDDA